MVHVCHHMVNGNASTSTAGTYDKAFRAIRNRRMLLHEFGLYLCICINTNNNDPHGRIIFCSIHHRLYIGMNISVVLLM